MPDSDLLSKVLSGAGPTGAIFFLMVISMILLWRFIGREVSKTIRETMNQIRLASENCKEASANNNSAASAGERAASANREAARIMETHGQTLQGLITQTGRARKRR